MSEMKIETLIRNFLDAYMKRDVDGTLSLARERALALKATRRSAI